MFTLKSLRSIPAMFSGRAAAADAPRVEQRAGEGARVHSCVFESAHKRRHGAGEVGAKHAQRLVGPILGGVPVDPMESIVPLNAIEAGGRLFTDYEDKEAALVRRVARKGRSAGRSLAVGRHARRHPSPEED